MIHSRKWMRNPIVFSTIFCMTNSIGWDTYVQGVLEQCGFKQCGITKARFTFWSQSIRFYSEISVIPRNSVIFVSHPSIDSNSAIYFWDTNAHYSRTYYTGCPKNHACLRLNGITNFQYCQKCYVTMGFFPVGSKLFTGMFIEIQFQTL